MMPWSSTPRTPGKPWPACPRTGEQRSGGSVASGLNPHDLFLCLWQRGRHQLPAAHRSAEEEVPPPGIQGHCILLLLHGRPVGGKAAGI